MKATLVGKRLWVARQQHKWSHPLKACYITTQSSDWWKKELHGKRLLARQQSTSSKTYCYGDPLAEPILPQISGFLLGWFFSYMLIQGSDGSSLGQSSTSETPTTPPPGRYRTTLRKAESLADRSIVEYENKLRANAPLDKVFKYFASVTKDGHYLMTPTDFCRSIIPGADIAPFAQPLNVPRRRNSIQHDTSAQILSFDRHSESSGTFFSFSDPSNPDGLIPYHRYLIFLTILSVPPRDLDIAFVMTDWDGNEKVSLEEYKKMLKKHVISRGLDIDDLPLWRHLFGPKLDQEMSLETFRTFVSTLRREVLRMEFNMYDPDKKDTISAYQFARSVVAHAPYVDKSDYKKRMDKLQETDLADYRITFAQFSAFNRVVNRIDLVERTILIYSNAQRKFTPSNFVRAAKAIAQVNLEPELVKLLFFIFDRDEDGTLRHEGSQ